jgi:hypothetical protein
MNNGLVINGQIFTSANAETKLDGEIYDGFASFNFKDSISPKKVRGTGSIAIGDTTGDYDAEADCEMYYQHAVAFFAALKAKAVNGSIGLVQFDITIHFDNGVDSVGEVILQTVRVIGREGGFATGGDESKVKIPLFVRKLIMNGIELITKADGGGL